MDRGDHFRPNQGAATLGGAFRPVPRTGVIFVTEEATARGYHAGHPEWANLGQGQPETGDLPGAPPRVEAVAVDPRDQEYAPVAGLPELRAAVADFYNRTYRRGLRSQYSAENVCIAGGGRAALTRVAASLGQIHLGHFLPDYTAYEELLDIFRAFLPTPILLDAERAFAFDAADLRREILGRGLSGVLMSNPCNPTGRLVWGDELAAWVSTARELGCALLIDEFYSHYVWAAGAPPMESAARYVEDVDLDPVVILDGLTKNWRYPGWRVSWTLGPKRVIEALASAGSFLDGGGSRPLQRAAVPLLEPATVEAELAAVRRAFLAKRELMVRRVRELGLGVDLEPEGSFYVFASLAGLPEPLDDCMTFFGAALAQKLICVPGVFFDVNPGQRRSRRLARFRQHVRLSFGPPMEEVERGLEKLERVVAAGRR
ncbi:MAG TPA: pyridoxal phosphate-dependent aminotransferase [Thermoanaerobaculia bacterium]|nr:pyridoxal phosphate-dependent aminotransferase [Thermoanaerobaculia bacterium]